MNNQVQKKKSNAPYIIIGLLAIVVVGAVVVGVGGFGFGSKSNSNNGVKPTPGNTAKSNAIPANAPAGATPPNYAGSPTAAVTIEEFADFQCPQCASTFPVMNEIKSLYGSRIRFIYRNFPLSIPAHDKSYDASVATEAAGNQGKFWEMHAQLFQNQSKWTADPNYKAIWLDYAKQIGLDINKFTTDMAGVFAKGRVDADKARGQAIGVNSTPSLYLNGNAIPFSEVSVNGLKALIDAELAKAPAPAPANPATPIAPATK